MKQKNSHQNIASRMDRFLGFVLDVIAPFVVIIPILLLFGEKSGFSSLLSGLGIILMVILQFVLMYRRSQTIGKFLMNIQVVSIATGERYEFFMYWLVREIVGKTLVIGMLPILNIFFQPIYFLIDSLFIFSKQNRTLHDRIAGTVVIKLEEDKRRKDFFDITTLPK